MPSHQLEHTKSSAHRRNRVEIILDPGETVIAEAGAMNYMTDGVRFETRMGDGSASGAAGQALWSAGKRMLTGESLFMTALQQCQQGQATGSLRGALSGHRGAHRSGEDRRRA